MTEFHIQEIFKFWIEHNSKRIIFRKIQITRKRNVVILKGFLTGASYPSWRKSWIYHSRSTIRWIGATCQFQIKKCFEATQLLLEDFWYKLIFIDEFSFTERKNNLYSWGPRSQHWRLSLSEGQFSCSWMVGFSRNYFYGGLITKDTWSRKCLSNLFTVELKPGKCILIFRTDAWFSFKITHRSIKVKWFESISKRPKSK